MVSVVPAVVISGAGDDAMGGGYALKSVTKFREGRGIIDDKISGHGDEVGFFLLESIFDLRYELVVGARAVVDVGDLCNPESVKGLWPSGKREFFASDGKEVGFDGGRPETTGDSNS